MKNNAFFKGMLLASVSMFSMAGAQTLLHYWNFNNNASVATITTPNVSIVAGAKITANVVGISAIDPAGGTKQNFDVENLNSRNGDPAGTHLRFNDPIGSSLEFALPTTGYNNIVVKFTTRRSGSGAGTQKWSYSADGTMWKAFQTVTPMDANPQLLTLDFSQIAEAANNPNFKLKVEFEAGNGGTVGNNRFDNFTVDSGTAPAPAKASVAKNFIKINEDARTLAFVVNVSNPVAGSVDLVLKPAAFNTADEADFTFSKQTINIVPEQTQYIVNIPIIDDAVAEQQAEYFNVELQNGVNTTIDSKPMSTIYIVDNDSKAPVGNGELQLNYVGSFDPSASNKSSVEIIAYDPVTKRLFASSAITNVLDIIDYSDPRTPSVIKTIDMAPYGGITSVAVKNGTVAVASPNANPQENGSVVFFDTNGNYISKVTVGALPDMVTFSPDGKTVMTANEGEPNADYTVDPEGSVSIIGITGGAAGVSQNHVNTLLFTQFNAQESELIAAGVRKLKKSSTLSQDFEPEYISISADNKRAYVTIQESNAVAEINLETKSIAKVWPLGKKDMSKPGNGFDASDNNGEILIANWPVKSYYIPDALQTYNVGGKNYIITANEGDEKEFSALNERTSVDAAAYVLDPAVFPQASMLKASYNLGRFRVTNQNGNLDADAEFEEINSVGARSFSIFNADTGEIIYDSGDAFERITAERMPTLFNSDHEENKLKSRSRSKGPEPEGVALAAINGKTYAFISLERIGGVMAYNVTDPAQPTFVDYKNPRNTAAYGGDNGPEGIIYIPASDSGTGKAYVLVANEISGTISTYELSGTALSTAESKHANFSVYPNPVSQGAILNMSEATDYALYDMSGKLVGKGTRTKAVSTSALSKGLYILKTSAGASTKVLVK